MPTALDEIVPNHVDDRPPVIRLSLADDLAALAPAWDALVDRTGGAPFLRPGWLLPWSEAFAPGRLRALTAWRDDELVGVMALVIGAGTAATPANEHTPFSDLVAADDETARSMASWLFEPGRYRRIDLQRVPRDGRGWPVLSASVRAVSRPAVAWIPVRSPYVALDGDWESFCGGLSRTLRKQMRRLERRLDEHGAVELEVADGRADLERLLAEGFALEASGWKREAGTAILSEPRTERLYRGVAQWAAERGMLRLLFLRSGGRGVAFDLCLQDHGSLYVLKGGFDPAFAQYRPGMLLSWRTLRHGFESGLRRYDLLGADDPYKLRWTAEIREATRLLAFSRSPRGMVEWAAHRHGRPIARRVRGLPAAQQVTL